MEEFRKLYGLLTGVRRRQLFLTLLLMFVGAAAEMLTIGSVLPFLAFLADPGSALIPVQLTGFLESIGGSAGGGAAILLSIAALAAGGVRLLLTWRTQALVAAIGTDLALGLFARTLNRPYADHIGRNSSRTLATVEHVQRVVHNVLVPALQAVTGGVMALFIAILLFMIDAVAAAASIAAVVTIYLALTALTGPILRRNSRVMSVAAVERTQVLQEGLGGIRDILLYRAQKPLQDRLFQSDRRYRRAQALGIFLAQSPRYVLEAGGVITLAAIAAIMSSRPGGVVSAIPVLGALALGAQRVLPLIQQVYAGWSLGTANFEAFRNIVNSLYPPPAAQATGEPLPLRFETSIAFKDITFRQPGEDFSLSGVSFEIGRGEHVGISGRTGSGKSTILDLLMGLLEPGEGSILVDGKPIGPAERPAWQASLAHVPQNLYLIDDTIAANIAFPRAVDEVAPDQLDQAIRIAQLEPFLATLAAGSATRVGERGINLSSGQRQRIAIARALARSPQLLILDEATSALDVSTENAIYQALREVDGLTIVTVAHRGSALSHCSRLLVVENGSIRPEP